MDLEWAGAAIESAAAEPTNDGAARRTGHQLRARVLARDERSCPVGEVHMNGSAEHSPHHNEIGESCCWGKLLLPGIGAD